MNTGTEEDKEKLQIDPLLYPITDVHMGFSDENFLIRITSNYTAFEFLATPKHAKRIFLLLQDKISRYEKEFETLDTELVKGKDAAKSEPVGFVSSEKKD